MGKIGAIICELNPFHNGHKYLIDCARDIGITHLIAIMSGNFVQRGEPAIVSSQTRTEIALSCGFDLVIELPSIWSMSTAEKFAYSGVYIAESLRCVDSLIFGSESNNLSFLDKISDLVLSYLFSKTMKPYLKSGLTFAKARELAINSILGEQYSRIVKNPNDILAIEYLKALKILKSSIQPLSFKRLGTHNSNAPVSRFASSSYIRHCITDNNNEWSKYVPTECYKAVSEQIANKQSPITTQPLERAILYKLKTMHRQDFLCLPDVGEGLENRIFNASLQARSFSELISLIKTKRYTESRIRRIIMCAFLGISKSDQSENIPYAKVLGANNKGFEILKNLPSIPIITRHADCKKLDIGGKVMFEKNHKLDSIYSLMVPEILFSNFIQNQKIIIKKDD